MAGEHDPFKDIKDQFSEMRESLDKIAEHTKPVAEVAKTQIKHDHRPNAPTPKVDLDKNTKRDILAALKNIRSQIVVSQRRENTMADVAADALASGQSLAGAAKEALGFKKDKLKASFKRKFDPLNIVHRITGGSKLATALAGRVMGRSEQSIRGAAGLQQQMETPSAFMGGQMDAPSPVASDKTTTLLEQMSSTLTQILTHLTTLNASSQKIQESEQEQSKSAEKQATTLERIHDEAKDTAAASIAPEAGAPMQIDKDGKPVAKEEGGLGGMFKKLLGFLIGPLGLAIAGLVASGVLIYKQWNNIKTSIGLLKQSISDLWESIKSGVGMMKDWVSDFFTSIYDTVLDASDSLVDGVVSILNKLPGVNIDVPTEEERHANLKKTAETGEGYAKGRAQRKLAKEVAPDSEVTKITTSVATGFAQQGQSKNLTTDELQGLRDGKYTEEAVRGLRGVSPIKSPAAKILGQALAKSYGSLYTDEKGQPLRIKDDTQSEDRLKSLAPELSTHLADAIATQAPAITPGAVPTASATPTEIPMPAPQTGLMLSQANDIQRNATMAPAGQGPKGGNTIINNVKNNNTSSSTVHQNMSPARSEESSYLRSLDRGFAPA